MTMKKLIIVTAPSGSGKTTIVRHILSKYDELSFSISATTRDKRPHEKDGRDYYFFTVEKFKELIDTNAFVEWEEVYPNQYYGTLRAEIERLWKEGKQIVFDVDVKGAVSIKKAFPKESLALFIKVPSIEVLKERLQKRKTETAASLQKRLKRATAEMKYENKFDTVLVNDVLESALKEAEELVEAYLSS